MKYTTVFEAGWDTVLGYPAIVGLVGFDVLAIILLLSRLHSLPAWTDKVFLGTRNSPEMRAGLSAFYWLIIGFVAVASVFVFRYAYSMIDDLEAARNADQVRWVAGAVRNKRLLARGRNRLTRFEVAGETFEINPYRFSVGLSDPSIISEGTTVRLEIYERGEARQITTVAREVPGE